VIEAFDAGCPVLCANTTSLSEVAGDAALMCDPTDVEAIAKLMRQVLRNPALREELIRRGRRRVGQYDWATSAANLYAACQRVAERAGSHPQSPEPRGLARLYRHWYHELGFTVPRAWRELKRRGRSKLARFEKLADWAGSDPDVGRAIGRIAPVRGLGADNWLGPRAQFVIREVAAGQTLHLGGIAGVDTTVHIEIDGRPVESRGLKAGKHQILTWPADDLRGRCLSLRFSEYVVDERGRKRSFLIEDTNLFSEDDVG
jgi:hypothetical protein